MQLYKRLSEIYSPISPSPFNTHTTEHPGRKAGVLSACRKSLAEFATAVANQIKSIFCRGVYMVENTSQLVSVEFVRETRTNYARNKLQLTRKSGTATFSTVSNRPFRAGFRVSRNLAVQLSTSQVSFAYFAYIVI